MSVLKIELKFKKNDIQYMTDVPLCRLYSKVDRICVIISSFFERQHFH